MDWTNLGVFWLGVSCGGVSVWIVMFMIMRRKISERDATIVELMWQRGDMTSPLDGAKRFDRNTYH